jgi:uncharacterized 2Fe-2S/4Fe-4S cluster protein (DUF4445 family)
MDFAIRFLPEDRTYVAQQPAELMLAAAACDIWVEQPCGSKTICGKCRVRVLEGDAPVSPADERLLTREEIRDGWRLACQLALASSAVVEIPAITRSVAAKPFGDAELFSGGFRQNIVKRYLALEPPGENNQHAGLDLISRALGSPRLLADLSLVHSAAHALRECDHKVSAVVNTDEGCPTLVSPALSGTGWGCSPELLALEPGDTAARSFGAAVDLGSTTLAAALINLHTGAVVSAVSRLNPQVRHGADVISRIQYAQEHHGGGDQLHGELLGAIRQMLEELAAQASVEPHEIYAVTCAGNATMTHSALGADITPLGQAPYVGLWTREWTVKARELELPINRHGVVRFMPMIRSHVGGDTVAAVLAAGMDRSEGWQLLIDLGTNSEVVIGNRHRMVATSTAAGPAFEGANIHHGMRAAPGAIDQVRISPDGRVVVKTVGNEPARGLCGSGLVDACAELVRMGVIAPSGYMRKPDEVAQLVGHGSSARDSLRARCLTLPDGQAAFRLAGEVVLAARDVRQLQLIKGSIYAGLEILRDHLRISLDHLDRVSIAGAFGNFLRKESAQAIGLVPNIDPEKVQFIGNAAGVGARMALVDAEARARANRISETCEYVELAGHPDYQDAFCAAIPFPEPVATTQEFQPQRTPRK